MYILFCALQKWVANLTGLGKAPLGDFGYDEAYVSEEIVSVL